VSPPLSQLSTTQWHMKLESLASLLRTKFQAYVILGENVSFDEMIVPFSGRSRHTLKMKISLFLKGSKFGHYVTIDIYRISFFYSCMSGKLHIYLLVYLN